MNIKRAMSIAVVGGALAVWLTAAATSSNRDVAPAPVATTAPLDAGGAKLANEIARLHDRLRPTEVPRHGRNLFQFGAGRLRSAPAPAGVDGPAPTDVAPVPLPPPRPSLRLIGVAEDEGPNGPVRTAILTGAGGQLLLVKEGDAATTRYRVGKIAADVVELTDTSDGSVVRLALR